MYSTSFETNMYETIDCELSFGQSILIFISTVQLGLLFSFGIVAYFHTFMFRRDTEENIITTTIDFISKYPIENAITETDIETEGEQEIKRVNENSYVMDFSPQGIVILKYNYDQEGFEYWTNPKTIKYNILETMARKYVKVFCCHNLYINRTKEIEQKKEAIEENKRRLRELEEMSEEDKPTEEVAEESVFASFKSYNKGGPNTKIANSNIIVADRSNKYIHKGTIGEFELLKTTPEVKTTIKKIDFSTFKEMFFKELDDENLICSDTDAESIVNGKEALELDIDYYNNVPRLPGSIETSEETLSIHSTEQCSLDTKKDL